jgi:hypothetical protein
LRTLLGVLVAIVGAVPAMAFQFPFPLPFPWPFPSPHPVPVPAPELAVGAPAVFAVICAYVIARLVIRHRKASKALGS